MREVVRRLSLSLLSLLALLATCCTLRASTDFVVPPGADPQPFGITKGPDGNVWFVENLRNAIAKITPGGKVTEYPVPGAHGLERITTGPDGNLWFTDSYYSYPNPESFIGKITPSGTITLYQATFFYPGYPADTFPASPIDIAPGPDGALWFTSQYGYYNLIGRIDTSGNVSQVSITSPNTYTYPDSRLVLGSDNNLWYIDGGASATIAQLSVTGATKGQVLREVQVSSNNYGNINDLVAGPDGNIWATGTTYVTACVCAEPAIFKITPAGAVSKFFPNSGSNLYDIAAGPDGNLWFKEYVYNINSYYGYAIGFVTTTGSISEALAGLQSTQLHYYGGISPGNDGNVWSADYSFNDIHKIVVASKTIVEEKLALSAQPTVITTGADGNLWFIESRSQEIGRSTPVGNITSFPMPTLNSQPQRITKGPGGAGGVAWFTELGPLDASNNYQVGAQRVARINADGSISEFPVPADTTANCANYYGPVGITLGNDHNIWVADQCGLIERFDPVTGQQTAAVQVAPGVGYGFPSSIAAGPNNDPNVWFLDTYSGAVNKVSTATATLGTGIPISPLYFSYGGPLDAITAASDGNLWFGELAGTLSGKTFYGLGQVTPSGQYTPFNLGNAPFYVYGTLISGADGALWGTSGSSAYSVSTQGTYQDCSGPGGSGYFTSCPGFPSNLPGITTGPDGKLWVTQQSSSTISRFSAISGSIQITPDCTQPNSCLSNTLVSFQANFTDGTPGAQATDLTATVTLQAVTANYTYSQFAAPVVSIGPGQFAVVLQPQTLVLSGTYYLYLTLHDSVDNQDYFTQSTFTIGYNTTTTLTATPNPAGVGFPVTMNAHVVPAKAGPAITGSVAFFDGYGYCNGNSSGALGTAGVDQNGYASFTTASLTAGQHTLTACYIGDNNYMSTINSVPYVYEKVLPVQGDLFGNNAIFNGGQSVVQGAYALASADFDGDGVPDLVAAQNVQGATTYGQWTVLHGYGDGTLYPYTNGASYPYFGVTQGVAVGDFNGDGKPDLVTTSRVDDAGDPGQTDGVEIFLNSYGYPGYYPNNVYASGPANSNLGTRPVAVAVGDFNRDGKLDLAVVNRGINPSDAGGNSVSIMFGNGDGTFQNAINYAVGATPQKIITGDFNRDGALDVAVTNSANNSITVLLNNGSGVFTASAQSPIAVGTTPIGLVAGDLNGDGKLDIAVANSGDNTVSVLLGNGDGTFQNAVAYSSGPAGSTPWTVAIGDINRDGKLDLLVANSGGSTLAELAGNGDGSFRSAQQYAVDQTPRDVLAIDANRDGAVDVVTANEAGYSIVTSITNAQVVSNVATLTTSNAPFAVGNTVTVSGMTPDSFYNGTYTVTAVSGYTFSYALTHADAGPTTEAGTASTPNGGDISVLMGVSPGPQNPNYALSNLPAGQTPSRVAVGDFDRSGKTDIAVVDTNFNSVSNCPLPSGTSPCDAVSVLLNNGTTGGVTTFAPHADYLLPDTFTNSVAIGDFNRDGIPDLVTVSGLHTGNGTPGVNILLGNSNGTFQAPVTYNGGPDPKAVAVGDFNGDGILDLAVADKTSGNVNVLLGDPANPGLLLSAVSYVSGISPTALVAGDFNSDGKLDLAVLNSGGDNVGILLGNGDGTFQTGSPVSIPLPNIANSGSAIAVGDFNRDGKLDLAVSNQNNMVSIVFGNGDGTFQFPPTNYVTSTSSSVWGISVVDYNHDGIPDLALASNTDNAVTLLAGNGDGTFLPPMQISVGANTLPSGIAFADLNGDGVPDIITGNQGTNSVSVLLSGTKGASQTNIAGCSGGTTVATVLADFNGDGLNDLAVLNGGTCNSVTVQLNDPNNPGTLQAALVPSNAVGSSPSAMAAGAFVTANKNIIDLVVANKADNTVSVLIGNGDGTFQPQVAYSTGAGTSAPSSIFVTDVNNDGNLDIAVVNSGSGNVSVLLGNGNGTFGTAQTFSVSPHLPPALNGSLSLGAAGMSMGDLNGDGVPDMVVTEPGANQVSVFINSGLGGFANPAPYQVGMNPQAAAIGHFKSSGLADCSKAFCDVAVVNQGSDTVSILLNDGTGKFGVARTFATGRGPSAIGVVDYNNDGKLDLVVTNSTDNTVMVLPGNGDGTFQSGIVIGAATGPNSVSVGSLTSGGSNDIVVTNGSGNNIGVLLNQAAVKMGCLAPGTLTAGVCVMPAVTFGNPITFTATIAAAATSARLPGGSVTFTNQTSGTVLGTVSVDSSGHAVLGTNRLPASNPPGTSYTITGGYSGDSYFNNGSVTFSQTVNPAGTTVSVSASQNPSSIGQPVTFTASVGSGVSIAIPTGAVQFVLDQGTANQKSMGAAVTLDPLGNAVLSYGGGTCPQTCLSIGAHTITATYTPASGSSFLSSTSAPFSQQSNPATSTVVLSSPGQSSVYNQPIAFTVNVTGGNNSLMPTGTVNVTYDNGTALKTVSLSNGSGQFSVSTLPIGTHVLSATYVPGSDPNFSSATSMPIAQVVKQAPTRSLITSSVNPGASPTLTVGVAGTYGGTATGNVNFNDTVVGGGTTTQLGSPALSGNGVSLTPTLVGNGIHHIVATYVGDNNFLGSSDGIWQVVSSGGANTTLKATVTSPCASCVGRAGQLKIFNKATNFVLQLQLTSPTAGTDTGTVLVIDDDTVLASSDGSAGVMLTPSNGCGPAPGGQSTVACYNFPIPPLTIGQHQFIAVAANDGTYNGAAANSGQPVPVSVTPQPH